MAPAAVERTQNPPWFENGRKLPPQRACRQNPRHGERCWSMSAPGVRVPHQPPPTRPPHAAIAFGTVGPPGHVTTAASTRTHSCRPPGDQRVSRATRNRAHSTPAARTPRPLRTGADDGHPRSSPPTACNVVQQDRGYTPTPVISRHPGTWNRGRVAGLADGVMIAPLIISRRRRLQIQSAGGRPGQHGYSQMDSGSK